MSDRYCVIKRTEVINDALKLPRPKIVKTVLYVGARDECMDMCDELSKLPENQPNEDIDVVIFYERFNGQRSNTSSRPGNGKR